jgi:hypothetical protein
VSNIVPLTQLCWCFLLVHVFLMVMINLWGFISLAPLVFIYDEDFNVLCVHNLILVWHYFVCVVRDLHLHLHCFYTAKNYLHDLTLTVTHSVNLKLYTCTTLVTTIIIRHLTHTCDYHPRPFVLHMNSQATIDELWNCWWTC